MASKLDVAFVWHMHQPLYKDRTSGRYQMPWARLHATKDYLDMVLALEGHPSLRQTFNLVPVLLEQLADYAAGTAWDRPLELLARPGTAFSDDEKLEILARGFDVHAPTMAEPYPRYAGLLRRRDALRDVPPRRAIRAFDAQDWVDLVVWWNMAWFDPRWLAEDAALATLVAKGAGFDDADRAALVGLIRAYVGRVIPAYRAAAERGQVELTTTPYYHPILPLLCDVASARVAIPDLPLPAEPFARPEDAAAQLRAGLDAFAGWFGHRPAGLWPSEQAVSPAVAALMAREGLSWAISDEGVLGRSLGRPFVRTASGVPADASLLYRPYRVETPDGPVAMVFRDAVLSDLIGFTYGGMAPEAAAADLHGRLDRIRRLLPDGEAYLVTIALDGENCWERYERDGGPFLEAFYRRFEADPKLRMVTVSGHLAEHPPREALKTLHAGSWIGADFTTWIGDPTKNLAWDALARAREALAEARPRLEGTPAWREALDELHAAEGSDWFWWFGEGHDSGQDDRFDAQFRMHLRRLYELADQEPPAALSQPIAPPPEALDPAAGGLQAPTIDGQLGDPAWAAAAAFDPTAGQGAAHAAARAVRLVRWGCDAATLYLGLAYGPAYEPLPGDELGLFFIHPGRARLNAALPYVVEPAAGASTAGWHFAHAARFDPAAGRATIEEAGEHGAWHVVGEPAAWASGRALEAAIPLAWLDPEPGQELRFVVAVAREGRLVEVLPADGGLPLTVVGEPALAPSEPRA